MKITEFHDIVRKYNCKETKRHHEERQNNGPIPVYWNPGIKILVEGFIFFF